VPVIESIHQRIFDAASQTGALNMAGVHTCSTTHCRAGWAVHLAGEAGYALEQRHGWCLAAQLIYRASGYQISPVRFYESNEVAMADMQHLAEAKSNG
jgi:hypothetical protein